MCVCLFFFSFSFSIVHPFTTGQFSVSIGVEEKYLKKNELAKSEDWREFERLIIDARLTVYRRNNTAQTQEEEKCQLDLQRLSTELPSSSHSSSSFFHFILFEKIWENHFNTGNSLPLHWTDPVYDSTHPHTHIIVIKKKIKKKKRVALLRVWEPHLLSFFRVPTQRREIPEFE